MNKSPRQQLLLGLALFMAVGSLAYLGHKLFMRPVRPMSLNYFYNEKTKQLFTASDQLVPPIDTESGPATGVRAYVFTCSDPKDESKRFIAFLEKLTPEAQKLVSADLKTNSSPLALGFAMERFRNSVLIRSVSNETWVPKYSGQGMAIMKMGKESGGCERPAICLP